VGRRAAEAYLLDLEGLASPSLAEARLTRKRSEAYAAFLRETARELEAVYASPASPDEKRRAKAGIIAARAAAYREEGPRLFGSGPDAAGWRDFDMGTINNAWLDLYRLYDGEGELYADYCRLVCKDDLAAFIAKARVLAKAKDPKAQMRLDLAALGRG
jgi:predicted aminopeptidase